MDEFSIIYLLVPDKEVHQSVYRLIYIYLFWIEIGTLVFIKASIYVLVLDKYVCKGVYIGQCVSAYPGQV